MNLFYIGSFAPSETSLSKRQVLSLEGTCHFVSLILPCDNVTYSYFFAISKSFTNTRNVVKETFIIVFAIYISKNEFTINIEDDLL